MTTVIGSGDSSYVTSPGGYVIGWLLAFFGVAIVATLTAAIVGFVIDFLLKEGQGMGAAGYSDHIVVCGWNATARELIEELKGDEFTAKVVAAARERAQPGRAGVYFVRGDTTSTDDLERAGIPDAAAAIICPSDAHERGRHALDPHRAGDRDDGPRCAPSSRSTTPSTSSTCAGARRRDPGDLAARLAAAGPHGPLPRARRAGHRHRLRRRRHRVYRVELPDDYADLDLDDLSSRLRREHNATLLAVSRDGRTLTNPSSDFRLARGDIAVVVAEGLGELHPLEPDEALDWPTEPAQWAPSRRAATRASARGPPRTTSATGTDSRGACASRTSPGP